MIERIQEKEKQTERALIIVTGLSGAGKTSVMRSLEDLGFYCVDNLPLPLLPTFLKLADHNDHFFKIALGIDARGEQFLSNFIAEMQNIRKHEISCQLKIVFVSAREETILKRFQETRRNHPLAIGISLEHAIKKERELMEPIMGLADTMLETDGLNIHDLRKFIHGRFSRDNQRELVINLMSFGFKYGVPSESNVIYDLRFLANPYFTTHLKDLDGKDEAVQKFIMSQPVASEYLDLIRKFFEFLLPKFYEEGRFFATISLGCTGGKHRSVCFVEQLNKETFPHVKLVVTHRDLGKE